MLIGGGEFQVATDFVQNTPLPTETNQALTQTFAPDNGGMNTQTALLALAACSMALNNANGSNRIQLLPAGAFRATDGRPLDVASWFVDAAQAQIIIGHMQSTPVDLVIDYDHQTLQKEQNGQPAPAAGWMRAPEWVEGQGLFVEVDWTAKAAQHIDAKEFKYISPVFLYDPKTGHVVKVVHAALTNTPALDNLQQVALAAMSSSFQTLSNHEEKPMNEALKLMLAMLGLPETTTEADAVAALNSVQSQLGDVKLQDALPDRLVALNAALIPDPAKFVPVETMQQMQTQLVALTAQVQGFQAENNQAVIAAALADGRLLPAQKAWAESLATTNMTALNQFLGTAQPLAALTQQQTNGKEQPGQLAALSVEQKAVAEQLGMSHADYQELLKGEA